MKNILVIGTKASFLIKGLLAKLEENGYNPDFSSIDFQEFDSKVNNADIIILYMDEGIYYQSVFLMHLADTLQRTYKMLILIGEKTERTVALQYIPEEFIENYYDRPLDLELLLLDLKISGFQKIRETEKKVILSVDDDPGYSRYLRDSLKGTYHVALAYSGAQAITWLATNHCDLILLDYGMPVANGRTIFEMLRGEDNTKDIPIIFLTGNNDKQSVIDIINLKPDDYLLKSIAKEELLEKLDVFFQNHADSSAGGEADKTTNASSSASGGSTAAGKTHDGSSDSTKEEEKPKSKHLMTTTDVILDYFDEDE